MLCVLVASILTSVAIPLTKYSVRAISQKNLSMLGITCLGFIVVYACKYWFTRGQVFYLAQASARVGLELRFRIFKKLMSLPIAYFNSKHSGEIQSVLNSDVNLYTNSINLIRDSIEGPVKAVGALVVVIFMRWQLAILALLTVAVLEALGIRSIRRVKKTQHDIQQLSGEYTSFTQEAVSGTRIIKSLAAEDEMRERHRAVLQRLYESSMRNTRVFAAQRPMMELVGAVSLAGALYVCGWLASIGSLKVEEIAALIMAMDVINSGFRSIISVRSNYAQVQTAAERIEKEVTGVDVVDEYHAGKRLERVLGHIEFRDVSFIYPDGTEALRKVNFEILPGSSLALVGPSGAGKSTIVDLLLKFYDPTGGQILLDGEDIRDLDSKWLRDHIGLVPQHTFLFAGSIADNLKIAAPDASEEDLVRATTEGHALPFIEASTGRFDALIGERGVGLSGGEQQRLSISRALLRDPQILVLDEATSSLDAISEKVVQEAIDSAMQRRTTLFIAHRLTTAARASRILVLAKGEIVETGSHEELIRKNGFYATMYSAFSSGVEVAG
jgi:subfamily B ATP-binding cassette protein MsbA